jgi:hypothetical protein
MVLDLLWHVVRAAIAATETIEGLCHTLLPSDLLTVRRGRG